MVDFNAEKQKRVWDIYARDDLSEAQKIGLAQENVTSKSRMPDFNKCEALLGLLVMEKEGDWSDLAVRLAQTAVSVYPQSDNAEDAQRNLGAWAHAMDHVMTADALADKRIRPAFDILVSEAIRKSVEMNYGGGYLLVCNIADYNYNCMMERGVEAGFAFAPASLQTPGYKQLAQARHRDRLAYHDYTTPLGMALLDHIDAPEQFFAEAKNLMANRKENFNWKNLPLEEATLYDCNGTLRNTQFPFAAAHYLTNVQFGRPVFVVTDGDPKAEQDMLAEEGLEVPNGVRSKADFAGKYYIREMYDDKGPSEQGLHVKNHYTPDRMVLFHSQEMQDAFAENLRAWEAKQKARPGIQPA